MLLQNMKKISLIELDPKSQAYCVGGRHKSNTIDIIQYEQLNPKIPKLVKIIKGSCNNCGKNNSQNFTG